jgi:hypothetical protein
VTGCEKRRASALTGGLRLHSAAVGTPVHRSPGPAQRKGWSVIAPHRGDEQVVRDMPFDDTDADANLGKDRSVRALRFGHPPRVGVSLAILRHNAIDTSQHRQLPIETAPPGK